MTHRRHAGSSEPIPLKLSQAERQLLVDELGSWESRLVRRIRNATAEEPVPFTWQEVNSLATYVALAWIQSKHEENAQGLLRVYRRITALLNKRGIKSILSFGQGNRTTLGTGVRLTEGQRESLVRVTHLPPAVKQRLAEAPSGTQFLPFAPAQLDQVRRAIDEALPRAVNPHRKRLREVLDRLDETPPDAGPPSADP